jgi:UDP-N-acetyl-D-mannosaminuronic acid dehydrogenase
MINVIGLGYIGLPTALMLAAHGQQVVGSDHNPALIAQLSQGKVPFEEKGLPELFEQAFKNGIRFESLVQKSDVYIIAVPTPFEKITKKIDPSYVQNALTQILKVCESGAIIIVESTIAPGTFDKHLRPLITQQGLIIGKDVHLVHAPERIIPGKMVYELIHNARTLGADDPAIAEKVKAMYASFCQSPIVTTSIRSAEMTKIVENTYRDINIAYANELAKICREDEMDVYEVIKIANLHPRVNILQPGPGVGGHCISVDPWFLVGDYPGLANIILAARKINDSMPEFVLKRTRDIMTELHLTDFKQVGVYGLTYKENVDDTRESPTLQLFEAMANHLSGPLKCYDPYVKKDLFPTQVHDLDVFLKDLKLVIVMVGHQEIIDQIDKLKGKAVFDTRNVCPLEGTYKL